MPLQIAKQAHWQMPRLMPVYTMYTVYIQYGVYGIQSDHMQPPIYQKK